MLFNPLCKTVERSIPSATISVLIPWQQEDPGNCPQESFLQYHISITPLRLVLRPSVIHWLRLTKCVHVSALMNSKPSRIVYMLYIYKWSNHNPLSWSSIPLSFPLFYSFLKKLSFLETILHIFTGRADNHSPYHHGNWQILMATALKRSHHSSLYALIATE